MRVVEWMGKLSNGEFESQPLRMSATFSSVGGHSIVGVIHGTKSDYHNLLPLMDRSTFFLKVRTEEVHPQQEMVFSDSAILRTLAHPFIAGLDSSKVVQSIGELEFLDITLESKLSGAEDQSDRRVTYYLTGPSGYWGAAWRIEKEADGKFRQAEARQTLDLDMDAPIELQIAARRLSDRYGREAQITTYVWTLECITRASRDELNDDAFLNRSRECIEDLCLLVSFLSKGAVDWHTYSFYNGTLIQQMYRSRMGSKRDVSINDVVVDLSDANDFFRRAFKSLRARRASGQDVALPLRLFLAAQEARYVDERFVLLFRALEGLIGKVSSKQSKKLLSGTKFDSLRSHLANRLRELVPDESLQTSLIEKLPELNRPAFARRLSAVLDDLSLTLDDLYPAGEKPSFIKTRDHLVHSGTEPPIDVMVKDAHRVEAIFDRIVLKVLGWNDASLAPHSWKQRWLCKT